MLQADNVVETRASLTRVLPIPDWQEEEFVLCTKDSSLVCYATLDYRVSGQIEIKPNGASFEVCDALCVTQGAWHKRPISVFLSESGFVCRLNRMADWKLLHGLDLAVVIEGAKMFPRVTYQGKNVDFSCQAEERELWVNEKNRTKLEKPFRERSRLYIDSDTGTAILRWRRTEFCPRNGGSTYFRGDWVIVCTNDPIVKALTMPAVHLEWEKN